MLTLSSDYKKEPEGGPLKERKHWLNDDYVKFIRFAHDRIVRTGHGVVAFIINHGWPDNPTFRGMRASLMRDFDEIYVLDLHGNSKKKERTPKALAAQGDDKNVFDIQVGVSIVFLLKKTKSPFVLKAQDTAQKSLKSRIYHHELWSSREYKYDWLQDNSLENVPWKTLQPAKPLLLLVPRDEILATEYEYGWKMTDIMPINSTGIVTARDKLVFDFTKNEIVKKFKRFVDPEISDEETRRYFFHSHEKGAGKYLPGDSWNFFMSSARQQMQDMQWQNFIQPCLYRPFDIRYLVYKKEVIEGGRWEVMRHLVNVPDNIGLVTIRQSVVDEPFSHVGISDCLIDNRMFYSNKGIPILFPLWLRQSDDIAPLPLKTYLPIFMPYCTRPAIVSATLNF